VRIKLRSYHIQAIDSRSIAFAINSYTFFLATVLLFVSDPYWYILSSLIIRGLYAVVVSFKLVLNFGTYLQLKNSDFVDIFDMFCSSGSFVCCSWYYSYVSITPNEESGTVGEQQISRNRDVELA
jgi:hypothetical protein